MPPYNNNNNNSPIVLNVAEKPSVARALQGVFGQMPGATSRGSQRDGASQVYTHERVPFPALHLQGQYHVLPSNTPTTPHTMVTTAVRGHLASHDFDSGRYGWSRCRPVDLFEAPIDTFYKDDMQLLQRTLTKFARQATHVILWLDCDREGEAIGHEVQNVCLQAGNPRLTLQQIYRAKFSTVLAAEIQRALRSLGRLQVPLVHAVQLRSELDLRVGAAFTRFQTLRMQDQFDYESHSNVLSYGPCQFPTLGFVVERWARIQTFVPSAFWTIELTLTCPTPNENGDNNHQQSRPIHFTWKRNRLFDQLLATVLYEECLEGGDAVVVSMNGRPKNKWRPVPLATVELQKRASRYLRIGSEQLMAAAEDLYNNGYISYPRTETERFRPEFQHQPLLQQFAGLQGQQNDEFANYAQKLLTQGGFQNPRAGQHDDQAHPPITPCKAVDPNTIPDSTQRGVYTLVVKHYLACCSRDAVGRETTLTVRIATEEFSATGLMILEHNWLEIYQPWERWSTGQGELPNLQVGSRVTPDSLVLKAGSTTPPLPLSEVELISLMDRNGIGTDATIATHIATIQERSYARKDGQQKFTPTSLGIALIQGYNTMGYQLNKPDLRREMEAECNHVAAGRKTKEQVLVPLLAKMKQTFETAVQEAHKLDTAMSQYFPRVGTGGGGNNNHHHGGNQPPAQVLQAQFTLCGVCSNPMQLKQQQLPQRGGGNNNNSVRKLLFCQTCNSGLSLPRNGQPQPHTSNNNPTRCPICQFQVVKIQRGDGYDGAGYNLCPKCYSAPPAEHSSGQTNQFKCFECQNAVCPLSSRVVGADLPVFACPFCHPPTQPQQAGQQFSGQVHVKTNSRGMVLSCTRYTSCGYTVWLPKECQSVSVVGGNHDNNGNENQPQNPAEAGCARCSNTAAQSVVRRLRFQWKQGSLPPHFGRETTVCVLCDADFRRELNLRLPQPGQVQSRPQANRNRGGGNNNAGRGGARGGGRGGRGQRGGRNQGRGRGRGGSDGGNVCFRCGEPGHFANSCPNG